MKLVVVQGQVNKKTKSNQSCQKSKPNEFCSIRFHELMRPLKLGSGNKGFQRMKKSWIEIRKDLYHHIRETVDEKMGGVPREIRNYQRVFSREFNRSWQAVSRTEFFRKLRRKQILFLADFHALKQSQRAHLRLLRKFEKEKPVLLLECFLSRDQEILDRFSAGKISEKKLLESIRWEENWSFPWIHYRPVVRWAVQNQIPLGGLNAAGEKSLRKRDQHAVEIVSRWREKFPDRKIFIQYGDLHLAYPHLPKMCVDKGLLAKKDLAIIHQNSEDLYFSLLEKGIENQTEIIELNPSTFCVMSVPPWVKWQNYLFYLENEYGNALTGRRGKETLDFTDHVAHLVSFIGHELGLKVSQSHLSVYTAEDGQFWKFIAKSVKPKQLLVYQEFIEEGVSFYLTEKGCGYLASPSVNHSAHLAALYIQSELRPKENQNFQFPKYFHQLIFQESLTYFGTKLVNHRRKTDTLFDMKTALAMTKSRELTRESLLLALSQKTRELLMLSGKQMKRPSFKPKRSYSYYVAARLLGGLLGEKLYLGYRRGHVTQEEIRSYFSAPLFDENFEKVYSQLLKKVDHLSLHFKSKTERL